MRRSRPVVLPSLAALLALSLLGRAAVAGPPLDATTRDYDQTHVEVRVTPDIPRETVDGETTVRFSSLADPLASLRLHCQDTTVLTVTGEDGAPLAWRLEDGLLHVALAKPLPRGTGSAVTVRYRSQPKAGLYFHAPTKAHPSMPLEMYSQGEGTDNRRWFPCYDEPDDRATVDLYATVQKDLKSIGNGALVESVPVGDTMRTDHWRLEQRVPSYLVSLIVGKFETVTDTLGDVRLEYHGPVGRAAEIRRGFARTKEMLAFLSEYTGRAFPYPRYAQTTVWDFVYGGMENASATTMNMRLLHGEDACPCYSPDGLVAHEMAHQWFGDLLTCRTWDHIWLNEGFATYFTDLFVEKGDGPAEFALARYRQNRGYMAGTPDASTLGLKPSPRGDVPLELHGGKQYDRGAAILHQLRLELGDDVFRGAMRRYVKENEDRAVVSEDLRRSCEAEAGRDLSWFFDQWVYGAGYPHLAVSVAYEPNRTVAHVTVEQTQHEGGGQAKEFRIRVPYRFGTRSEAGEIAGAFDVRRRRQVFDVDMKGAGAAPWLRVGVGGGTFARVKVEQPFEAWSAQAVGDPDPTGRLDAVEALPEWPDAAAPVLAKVLEADAVHAVRTAAAEALGRVPGPEASTALVAALRDADARVREAAATALGDRTREEAAGPLLALVRSDPSSYVRAAAARGLGKVHAAGAFDALKALLGMDSHREIVRAAALDGLASLGDARAVPLATERLAYDWPRGDHHGMRKSAMNLLTTLAPDDPATHAAIVRLLDDPYHRMRAWAAEAAGTFGVRSATDRLKRMSADDADGGARGAAKAALERLAGK